MNEAIDPKAIVPAVEARMDAWITAIGSKETDRLYAQVATGKRLRARLVAAIAGINERTVELAAVIELIHAASLLHDDVIDEARTRRGNASVNATDGSKRAVMLGDILYAKGFERLAGLGERVAVVVAGAVVWLSAGELEDVALAESFNSDTERYRTMIYQKTASLIEAAAVAAALVAGKESEPYALYGKNLGLAFQIIDDILDITQSEEKLGKPAMHDFREGKCTLPYIYLYEVLEGPQKQRLVDAFAREVDVKEQQWIRSMMQSSGALDQAREEARTLAAEAMRVMASLGEAALVEMVRAMVERDF